jgi:hypothetical protein
MRSQEEQRPTSEKARDSLSVLYVYSSINDMCFAPFMRSNFSSGAFGLTAVLAALMMMLWAAASNSEGIFLYLMLWFVAVAVQRVKAAARAKRGIYEHSRYSGWPWLAMKLLPLVKREDTAKRFVEPMICFVVGSLLCPISKPLGLFVMSGSFSIIFKFGIERQINYVRVQRLRDLQIEQRQLSERLYGERDDF